jgi:hypothetical protein
MDLQREADGERPWTVKSEEEAVRLESFRQGELDRFGRAVTPSTRMSDFYVERRDPNDAW